jgi:Sulfotransferase family
VKPHWRRTGRKLKRTVANSLDWLRIGYLRWVPGQWPCRKQQFLVVGCESSGTTAIANLLFNDGRRRFLLGGGRWTWQAYQDIYQGKSRVEDYPRLQLYDGLKVPGFAAILDKYVEAFPESRVVYVVRDPRDVLASAYRSKGANTRDELARISWVAEDWLATPVTDPVARLAFRWRRYLEVAASVPGVNYLRYEDFCANKLKAIEMLASKLGINVDADRVRSLCDQQASHSSVRPYLPMGPRHDRNRLVAASDEKIIFETCGPWMQQWGYSENPDAANQPADRNSIR